MAFTTTYRLLPVVALLAFSSAALADRPPTDGERAKIETVLRADGFTHWGEIEFDDGRWDIDDAVASDGRKYDIKLNEEFSIVKREID